MVHATSQTAALGSSLSVSIAAIPYSAVGLSSGLAASAALSAEAWHRAVLTTLLIPALIAVILSGLLYGSRSRAAERHHLGQHKPKPRGRRQGSNDIDSRRETDGTAFARNVSGWTAIPLPKIPPT
jgi:hypothetical protein